MYVYGGELEESSWTNGEASEVASGSMSITMAYAGRWLDTGWAIAGPC